MTKELSGAQAEVWNTYQSHLQSFVDQDYDALAELLSAGYTRTHINGRVQTRADWLAALRSGQVVYHSFDEISTKIEVDGSRATLTGRVIADATLFGERAAWQLQLRQTYLRSGGRWLASRTVATTW